MIRVYPQKFYLIRSLKKRVTGTLRSRLLQRLDSDPQVNSWRFIFFRFVQWWLFLRLLTKYVVRVQFLLLCLGFVFVTFNCSCDTSHRLVLSWVQKSLGYFKSQTNKLVDLMDVFRTSKTFSISCPYKYPRMIYVSERVCTNFYFFLQSLNEE